MSDYTEGCCFNYFRDNCSGRGCICKCHEEEAERLRQRSRDEDTARIRLNDARIKAEAERDALAAQVSALRGQFERVMAASCDACNGVADRDHWWLCVEARAVLAAGGAAQDAGGEGQG